MNRDEVLRDALTAVNGIRAGMGLEPLSELPKGIPESAGSCPIANALGHTVMVGSTIAVYSTGSARIRLVTPPSISRFLKKFDAGQYPELIE